MDCLQTHAVPADGRPESWRGALSLPSLPWACRCRRTPTHTPHIRFPEGMVMRRGWGSGPRVTAQTPLPPSCPGEPAGRSVHLQAEPRAEALRGCDPSKLEAFDVWNMACMGPSPVRLCSAGQHG